MKKLNKYNFSEIIFRENNALVTQQTFTGNLKIEGYTDTGLWKFEYKEYEDNEEQTQC